MTPLAQMDAGQLLAARYNSTAVYFSDSDCVEYVKEDTFTIYERVDEFLTLVWDDTKLTLMGFKLKGFRYIFETQLKPIFELHDEQFLDLVTALEAVCKDVGATLTADHKRARAYKAAMKLAANDNVKLSGDFLMNAAA